MNFVKTHDVVNSPLALGGYRPEAFPEIDTGELLEWGVHIGKKKGQLPFIQGYDLKVEGEPEQAFTGDVSFLKKHTDLLVLRSRDAAVAPAYQGRVISSGR